ncbi:hypothetical protein [Xenorhabdus sp. TH1]|uniref:hypothetical protein n=1 Tax=Xenorhabdus sp. TH1 TaxID=3130166 RepID=UPI0030D0E2C1
MKFRTFSHNNVRNRYIDHAALEREMELDNLIAQEREENRRHLHLKLRIADEIRKEKETHKHPSACEKLSHSFSLLDKTPIYSNGRDLFTLNKCFSRNLFTL